MTIERVTYQKTFNLGNYSSERIGADVLINPGEDAMQGIEIARQLVLDNFKKNNAELFKDQTPDIPIIPKKEENKITIKEAKEQSMPMYLADQIKSCSELKTLESYKFIVKGKPELQEVYDNKLKSLT